MQGCLLFIYLEHYLAALFWNNINSQLDATITNVVDNSAQHVSGDNLAHPQEHKNVFTACGIMHRRCCLLVTNMSPAGSIAGCIVPQAVNTF